ncbi:MAG: adenylyl-sulfate kinase, partial [Bacteroidia bacterium]|nr:adenylyl-sulfate kinase [Bacteroidia bacterium]
YALLLDGLKAEREQGITIDVAYRYFSTSRRKFIIADTPGHEQYTRNMATGASTANLAIILVDARNGVITQTKRHTYIVSLLGIRHVVVAVNKMDLMDYDQEVFDRICDDYRAFVTQLDIPDIHFIPLSALKGDNVVDLSDRMPWYHGRSLLEFLETVHVSSDRNFDDFRYPVQYVIRPELDYRGVAGKVASGVVHKGDEIMVLPSRITSRVKSITTYDGDMDYAFTPQSVSITLEDEIDVSRGDILVHPNNLPRIERHFEAMMVWMDESPMDPSRHFYIKQNTHNTRAKIDKIRYRVDVNTMEQSEVDHFNLNEIGRVVITTVKPLYFDPYLRNHNTGSFILIDPVSHNTIAVGMIIDKMSSEYLPSRITDSEEKQIVRGENLITGQEYRKRYNQKGATIWITGLHGSGKNVLAFSLEKRLFDEGATVILLDGKSVRSGLSRELDFTSAGRAEHLRRVAHICKILNDQGIITICSFISPDEDIRNQVAEIIGKDRFHLIYLDTDIDQCIKTDRYGLYKKFEEGKIDHMPGIDSTYDKPEHPDLVILPGDHENIEKAIGYLAKSGIFPLE